MQSQSYLLTILKFLSSLTIYLAVGHFTLSLTLSPQGRGDKSYLAVGHFTLSGESNPRPLEGEGLGLGCQKSCIHATSSE